MRLSNGRRYPSSGNGKLRPVAGAIPVARAPLSSRYLSSGFGYGGNDNLPVTLLVSIALHCALLGLVILWGLFIAWRHPALFKPIERLVHVRILPLDRKDVKSPDKKTDKTISRVLTASNGRAIPGLLAMRPDRMKLRPQKVQPAPRAKPVIQKPRPQTKPPIVKPRPVKLKPQKPHPVKPQPVKPKPVKLETVKPKPAPVKPQPVKPPTVTKLKPPTIRNVVQPKVAPRTPHPVRMAVVPLAPHRRTDASTTRRKLTPEPAHSLQHQRMATLPTDTNTDRRRRDDTAALPTDNSRHPAEPGNKPRRRQQNDDPFNNPTTPTTGGHNDNAQEPSPNGLPTARHDTGNPSPDEGPISDRRLPNTAPGGGSAGPTSNRSRGTDNDRDSPAAGASGLGHMRVAQASRRSGGGGASADPFDTAGPVPSNVRVAELDPSLGRGGGRGRGADGGTGGNVGSGGGGQTFDHGLRGAPGGGGNGGSNGWGGGHGRGGRGDEVAGGGGGGTGGGAGGGRGNGYGRGSGGSGGGRRARYAGDPFGDLGGGGHGSTHGGGGSGGGPGGPGHGARYAMRSGGGDSDGDGDGGFGGGHGHGFGGLGPGTGGGHGGNGGGHGRGGDGDGAGGDTPGDDDDNAGGDGGGRRGRTREAEHGQREGEKEDALGRGVWGGLTGMFYQDKDQSDRIKPSMQQHPIDWPTFTEFKGQQVDKNLDMNWGTKPPRPGMRDTFWSARWTGKIFVPKTDIYEFFFDRLDDGGRLILDGKKVIDVWQVQQSTPKSDKISLNRGIHDITIEYVQGPATEASISLSWRSSSFAKEIVGVYQPGNR
jgi:hypothetical protein